MKIKKDFSEYAAEISPSVNYLASTLSSKCSIEFDDAKQEMLFSAWKAYRSYDPSISKFVTYAVKRMKRRSITILSKFNKKYVLVKRQMLIGWLERELVSAQESYSNSSRKSQDMIKEITLGALKRIRSDLKVTTMRNALRFQVEYMTTEARQHLGSVVERFARNAVERIEKICVSKDSLYVDEVVERVIEEIQHEPSAEECFFEQFEKLLCQDRANRIQFLLKEAAEKLGGVMRQRAYELFVLLRNEVKLDRKNRMVPVERADAMRIMEKSNSYGNRLWKDHIEPLGTKEGRSRIVQQIKQAATKQKFKAIGGERMAAKKKSAKASKTKSKESKGRTPRKGGLHDKIDWVDAQFAEKGKTRPEAVEGLLTKYPEMSENYARTIVYSQMREYTFTPARRKSAAKPAAKKSSASKSTSAKKGTSKKASAKKKTTSKKKARPMDERDEFDDF